MGRPRKYSPEVRERAVRLAFDHEHQHDSQWAAIRSVAEKIGCTAETLRHWVRQAERDVVSTRNSNARLVVTQAWEARTTARASATAPWGSARMCWTMACCRPSASPAGLSGR